MPLFIDLHIDSELTPDLIKQCHVADKAIQEKYGVKYLQILLNQPQGYLFCLIDGPDKDACARVHQEAHGNIACNILEITESDFSALLANKRKDSLDFTINHDGSLDTGNRTVLGVNLLGSLEGSFSVKQTAHEVVQQHGGQITERPGSFMVALFESVTAALDAAQTIQHQGMNRALPFEIRLGIETGPPLKEKGDFFEDAIQSAERFSFIVPDGMVGISTRAMQLYSGNLKSAASVRVIHPGDEKFVKQLMEVTEKLWENNEISITDFSRELGMSKSQITRRLKALADFSPNDFLKEFRLRKALDLMNTQNMNVGEVTMAIGFSNPSYFTKCFRKRFGKAPSDYALTT